MSRCLGRLYTSLRCHRDAGHDGEHEHATGEDPCTWTWRESEDPRGTIEEQEIRIRTLESSLADAREANATILRILDGIAERLTPEESAEVAKQMQRAARGGA